MRRQINLQKQNLTKLPKNLPENVGGFDCSHNLLTTLGGCPKKIDSSFDCSYNKLTTLEDGPEKIGNTFYCYNNPNLSIFEIVKFIFKCEIGHGLFTPYNDRLLNNINKNKKDYKEIIRIIFK
jgi:hypothetical protein